MTLQEYETDALRTANSSAPFPPLFMAALGLGGEAGEVQEIIKKHYFQGHPLDQIALAEELGDVAWYLTVAADLAGFSLEDILRMNISKRRQRYPEGFSAERSVHCPEVEGEAHQERQQPELKPTAKQVWERMILELETIARHGTICDLCAHHGGDVNKEVPCRHCIDGGLHSGFVSGFRSWGEP